MDGKGRFKEILEIFRTLRDEMSKTVGSFYAWETLYLSRSIPTVGKEKAERNVQVINSYLNFFFTIENSLIDSFIIGISKFFDVDSRNFSIYFLMNEIRKNQGIFTKETLLEVCPNRFEEELLENYSPIEKEDESKIKCLKKKHSKTIKTLKSIRASRVHIIPQTTDNSSDGSFVINEVDNLIKAIQEILNTISCRLDRSTTLWDRLKEDVIMETNFLFENLYFSEQQRKKEIEEKWGV